MKKIYQQPITTVVLLNGGNVCQSLVIGSGQSDETTGDGNDLIKEDVVQKDPYHYNVWDDDWRTQGEGQH